MSSRNSRVVRNRDNDINPNIIKFISIVIAIILVITLIVVIIVNVKNNSKSSNWEYQDFSKEISHEYFILYSGGNVGVVDKGGNICVDAKYSDVYIPNPEKDVFVCKKDDENVEVLNKEGEKILKNYTISKIESAEENIESQNFLLKYKENDKYGLIDLDGNKVSEPIYDKITKLKENSNVILVKKDGKYGTLDLKGNVMFDTIYDSIASDQYCSAEELYKKTGFIVSLKDDNGVNYGYIDYKGKTILDTKYESIERVLSLGGDELYLIAMQNGKKGVFNSNKKIIDLNFQSITFSNVFVVNKNGKYGFYSKDGKVILKPKYSKYSVAGNYISVVDDEDTKLYDINGNLVNTNGYIKMIETDNPSYFIAENKDGTYSIISKDITIDEKFVQVEYSFDNYFIVSNSDGKVGVIDASNKEMKIKAKYDFILKIEGTSALEAIDGMNNYVDIYSKNFEKTISMENAVVNSLQNGYAVIYSSNDMKYINSNGEKVKNSEIYPDKKLYSSNKDGKWGYVNQSGKTVIDYKYDIVTEFNKYGFAGVEKDGKWGIVSENGEIIVEPKYELDTYYFPQFIGKYLLIQSEDLYCQEILE